MGIRNNQIQDDAISASKIGNLDAVLLYDSGAELPGAITAAGHLANKAYVDQEIANNVQGLDIKDSCVASTTGNLIATISGSGVGKTITNADPDQGAFATDGVTLASGERVLVKDLGGEVFNVDGFVAESGGGASSNYAFSDTGDFGKYWEFTAAGTDYYVWYNVDSALSDPSGAATGGNQPGGSTAISVAVTAADSAATIATNTASAISTALGAAVSISKAPTDNDDSVFVALANEGDVTNVSDGNGSGTLPAGPTFNVTQAGTGTSGSGSPSNGIYTVTTVGDGTTDWVLTRATDFDADSEVTANAFCFVEEGTTNGDSGFTLVTNDPITVDTTNQKWTQFSGAGQITAGVGLDKTGNNIFAKPDVTTTSAAQANAILAVSNGMSVGVDDASLEGSLQGAAGVEVLRIKDSGVTTAKINADAVNATKIADDAVQGEHLLDTMFACQTRETIFHTVFTGTESGTPVDADVGLQIEDAGSQTKKGILLARTGSGAPGDTWTVVQTVLGNGVFTTGDTLQIVSATSKQLTTLTAEDPNEPDGTLKAFEIVTPAGSDIVIEETVEAYRNGVLCTVVTDANAISNMTTTLRPEECHITQSGAGTAKINFAVAPAVGERLDVKFIKHT